MSRQLTVKLVSTDPRLHFAVRLWRQLHPDRPVPERIQILKGRRETSRRRAFRLVGAGPDAAPVIAKRTRAVKAAVEHAIYEQILPHLPLRTLRYYGRVIDPDPDYWWLFLEDAGQREYCATLKHHRRAAGRWLGIMHTLAAGVASLLRLPDLGPRHYLAQLHSARNRIGSNLGNPSLTANDHTTLRQILDTFDALERQWESIENFCQTMPRTLNHGDFVAKNIRVAGHEPDPLVLAFDWGGAGWGVPAADLAQSPRSSGRFTGNVSLASYWDVVRHHWPFLEPCTIRRWARLGTLFRTILATNWAARSLACDWTRDTMVWMQCYALELNEAVQRSAWRSD